MRIIRCQLKKIRFFNPADYDILVRKRDGDINNAFYFGNVKVCS